ncbi:hypothetical protein L1049_002677 [Liquidambar formosana]|uniref:Thioredoxin domain-containing protein n=1 Tax=Liquidambar formosana TaxID=63359 RepID=A0AAP0NHL6_LIQFO
MKKRDSCAPTEGVLRSFAPSTKEELMRVCGGSSLKKQRIRDTWRRLGLNGYDLGCESAVRRKRRLLCRLSAGVKKYKCDPGIIQDNWCEKTIGCVRAEPVIYKKLEASSDDVALLRAYVGDRPTWRNPQHPWRVDSRFNLKGVPTSVRWENEAVKGRLEDNEAHLEHKIDALVAGK